MKTNLLIIDPQNDFCDRKGSLYVSGAVNDIERITSFIKNKGNALNDIFVSLDTHNVIDIAHPSYWKDKNGKSPSPYTVITLSDIENGIWSPVNSLNDGWVRFYTKTLSEKGRYNLCIWPEHCLIGSWGANVHPMLQEELNEWQRKTGKTVIYIQKGFDQDTEQYSVFESEIAIESFDKSVNFGVIEDTLDCDKLFITGEARTHCVLNSVRSIAENAEDRINKLVILDDTMSNVAIPTAVDFADSYFAGLVSKGATITTTDKIIL